MKIKVETKALADALAELAPLAAKKTPLLILNNVKVVTKGNRIRLQCSDGTDTIRKYIEAVEIDADTEFLVDCVSLNSFLQKVKSTVIDMTVEDGTLTVKHEKGSAEFQTANVEEYPEPKTIDGEIVSVTLPSGTLSEIISAGKNFCGTDDLRPQMKGIKISIEDNNKLTFAATDTRMLIVDDINIPDTENAQWIISSTVFPILPKMLKNTESVEIQVAKNIVSYRAGNTIVYAAVINGNFPDVKRVIPQTFAINSTVGKSDVVDAIGRVSLFSDDSNLIKIAFKGMDLTISAANIGKLSKGEEHVFCTTDNEITLGVSANYFKVCTDAITTDDLELKMNDASRPILFADTNHPQRKIILMPMNLN